MIFVAKNSSYSSCDENSNNKTSCKADNEDDVNNGYNNKKCEDDNNQNKMDDVGNKSADDATLAAREVGLAPSSFSKKNAFSYFSTNNSSDNSEFHRELKRRRRMIEEAEQQENQLKMKQKGESRERMTPTSFGMSSHNRSSREDDSASSSKSSWKPTSFPGLSPFFSGSSSSAFCKEGTAGTTPPTYIVTSYHLALFLLLILYIAFRILLFS
jgi:hypothetical protein